MAQMRTLLSEKEDVIDKKSNVIVQQQQRIVQLEEYFRLAKHKRFGASSEQTPPEQGNLFNEAEVTELEPEAIEPPVTDNKAKKDVSRFQQTYRVSRSLLI